MEQKSLFHKDAIVVITRKVAVRTMFVKKDKFLEWAEKQAWFIILLPKEEYLDKFHDMEFLTPTGIIVTAHFQATNLWDVTNRLDRSED